MITAFTQIIFPFNSMYVTSKGEKVLGDLSTSCIVLGSHCLPSCNYSFILSEHIYWSCDMPRIFTK